MSDTQHNFVAKHYAPRAAAYVASPVHSAGADLDQIESLVRGRGDARVLDLGCGGGHVSYRVAPHVGEVVACDLTPDMLAHVKRTASERGLDNIRVQQGAAERLPFANASFDILLCRYTAHHWRDLEAGLREARRVLKTGGRAVFADAIAPAHPLLDTHLQTIELLRDPSHVRNYSAAEWIAALGRSGFSATGLTARKLPLDFASWTERTNTSELGAAAIRMVQTQASAAAREHFAIADDGGFQLDTLTIEAVASGA
ncbi:MAG: class I SAM-dependent methyltransferase [Roseiarcus sp.]